MEQIYISLIDNVLEKFNNIKVNNMTIDGDNYIYSFLLNDKNIRLTCPKKYPKCDECLYVDSDKQYSWIHSTNSFILDSIDDKSEQKTEEIFRKLIEDSKSILKKEEEIYSDDIYGDYECDVYMGFQQNDEDIQLMINKKRWDEKEKEIRKKYKSKLTLKQISNVNPIFSNNAAYEVLVNDLTTVIKQQSKMGLTVVPVDDNVYKWKVQITNFNENHKLMTQLAKLEKKYGYNYVELEFEFEMNLYPSYPPQVRLTKPRLENFMMGRIATMNHLKFSNWNPTMGMKYVIEIIKDLISEHGVINIENPRNSIISKAYLDIEYKLLNLSLLTGINPRVNNEFSIKQDMNNYILPKKNKDCKYWKSGVGFGFNGRNDWDINSHVAAEKEKDNNIYLILQDILTNLNKEEKDEYVAKIIDDSALIPIIESYLIGSTMLEISKHLDLFFVIIKIVQNMIHFNFVHLLDKLPNQNKSIFENLEPIYDDATIFLDTIAKSNQLTNELFSPEENKEINLCKMIINVFVLLKSKIKIYHDQIEKEEAVKILKNEQNKPLEDKYKEEVGPLQYDSVSIDIDNVFKKMGSKSNKLTRAGIMRIGKELCVFQKSLPLSVSSSVFFRTDDSKTNIMQFIITGPEDTPYSNGCFLFNMLITAGFPENPPKCLLVTTGGGSVRFNPNLYNCGKVCLSLLGTWSGNGGEIWNKHTSTLLQLLVSIQSLILVPNPYFNEPSYESEMHTEHGKEQNKIYNENIRYKTMQWAILDQLQNPSKGFEKVIRTNFRIKKDKILEECKIWTDECFQKNKNMYKSMYNNIENELNKLID